MDSKFPYDLKMEILSRTSLKTLDTMRCTSQEFQKHTYDSYFVNLYQQQQRNNIVSGLLLLNLRNGFEYTTEFAPSSREYSRSLDLGFLPRNARILASSEQGVMVLESPHPRDYKLVSYHVCKPATKQLLTLPNPKTKYLTTTVAMLVLSSKPLHYKIIRLSEPKREKRWKQYNIYRCEMFESRAWAWRVVDPVILPCSVFLCNDQQPVTMGGSIYTPLSNNQVLKFEAYSEKWTTLDPPPIHYPFDVIRKLVKYKGKLGLIICGISCEIWVLAIDESWKKLDGTSSLEAIYDRDSRVMNDYNTIPSYRNFTFRSDFEPADLRGCSS